jgi:hypothetical protein
MRWKLAVGIGILLVIAPSVLALDLSYFPYMFLEDRSISAVVVVGKNAKAEDVLGAIDIVTMLQYEVSKIGGTKQLNVAKLDSEIDDIHDHNSIIVGGPCANAAAAALLNYPEDCMEGFEVGKGFIRFYELPDGRISLLVAGATALDTRRATRALADYKNPVYKLEGKEVIISGMSFVDLGIKPAS